jgi:hypothetical protein
LLSRAAVAIKLGYRVNQDIDAFDLQEFAHETRSVASARALTGANSFFDRPLWTMRTKPRGVPILRRKTSAM